MKLATWKAARHSFVGGTWSCFYCKEPLASTEYTGRLGVRLGLVLLAESRDGLPAYGRPDRARLGGKDPHGALLSARGFAGVDKPLPVFVYCPSCRRGQNLGVL